MTQSFIQVIWSTALCYLIVAVFRSHSAGELITRCFITTGQTLIAMIINVILSPQLRLSRGCLAALVDLHSQVPQLGCTSIEDQCKIGTTKAKFASLEEAVLFCS